MHRLRLVGSLLLTCIKVRFSCDEVHIIMIMYMHKKKSGIYRILDECLLISSLPGKALRTLTSGIARLAERFDMRSRSRVCKT